MIQIGLPKAFLYYRYQVLWTVFFSELNCETIISGETDQVKLSEGQRLSADENCLPLKLFLGHVSSLIGRCDYILIPRFEACGKNDEFCVRFLGLCDVVRNTFNDVKILSYNLCATKINSEMLGFIRMGQSLGHGAAEAYKAYKKARAAQSLADKNAEITQERQFYSDKIKVMIAAQPYIIFDRYIGTPIIKMIKTEGALPLCSALCERKPCKKASKEISGGLYWLINKEICGAVARYKNAVDGVILLTAFPCGSDSLVNELLLRRVKGIPIIQIMIDGQQSETGLQTRIESFMDILKERRWVK